MMNHHLRCAQDRIRKGGLGWAEGERGRTCQEHAGRFGWICLLLLWWIFSEIRLLRIPSHVLSSVLELRWVSMSLIVGRKNNLKTSWIQPETICSAILTLCFRWERQLLVQCKDTDKGYTALFFYIFFYSIGISVVDKSIISSSSSRRALKGFHFFLHCLLCIGSRLSLSLWW